MQDKFPSEDSPHDVLAESADPYGKGKPRKHMDQLQPNDPNKGGWRDDLVADAEPAVSVKKLKIKVTRKSSTRASRASTRWVFPWLRRNPHCGPAKTTSTLP